MTVFLSRIFLLLSILAAPALCFGADVVKLLYTSTLFGDDQGKPLLAPAGLACSASPVLVIADSGNGRLLRMSYQNGLPTEFTEIKLTQLPYPIKVQMTAQGEILALDGKLHTVQRISPAGQPLGALNLVGVPDQEGMVIRSFRIDGKGNIYLLDIFRARVVVLAPDGKFVRSLSFSGRNGSFSDLAVDFKGDVFIVDATGHRVYVSRNAEPFVPLGEELASVADFPTGIATDAKGAIYLVDQNGGSVVALDPSGHFAGKLLGMGWKEGLLHYPTQICFDGQERAFIVDRGNDRIQVFKVIGE